MNKQEELQIIDRIIKGEDHLYAGLVELHSNKIFSVVRGAVRLSEPDVEEIVQDVFVKAFFSLRKFKGSSSFSTWLFRIAYNTAISRVRKKKKIEYVDSTGIERRSGAGDDMPDIHMDGEIDKYIDQEVKYKLIEEQLSGLPLKERFMIESFYLHEKSIKELSVIMDMSESNVKTKLYRIKKKISESISI